MDLGTSVINLILALLTLISIFASAVAVARVSLSKTTIETLKSSNAAFAERIEILEDANTRGLARVSALEAENNALRRVVAGADALARIETQLTVVVGMLREQVR